MLDKSPIKVLVLQPNVESSNLLTKLLSSAEVAQFELNAVDTLLAARQKMTSENMDVILLDLSLLENNIHETLDRFINDYPMTSVLVLADESMANLEKGLIQMGVEECIYRNEITESRLESSIQNSLARRKFLLELKSEKQILKRMLDSIDRGDFELESSSGKPLVKQIDTFLKAENARLHHKIRDLEARLKNLAFRDPLTGLDNLVMFEHVLKRYVSFAKRRKGRVGLLKLDIKQFRSLVQNYGALVGDQVLRQIAVRLNRIFRVEDLVARASNDNFFVIVTDHKKTADLSVVARKVLDTLTEPFDIDDGKIKLNLCIGISEYPLNGENVQTLMKNSDIALQSAKKLGPNIFQFATDELCSDHLARLHLENDLIKAIKERQFLLHYQPVMDLPSNKVVAVEALLRWRHPQFGLINPGEFLPLAERTGYIVEIGRWVIAQAFKQLAEWRKLTLTQHFKMSINLSPGQFHDTHLTQNISEQLALYGLRYQDVEFDVTEKALVQDEVSAVNVLQHIASLGGAASLDDFGTGFHSFEQINSLPLSALKIASRFVQKINQSEEANKMVKLIINLARQLGLRSLAEAVETQEQLDFLRQSGCERAQGYFICKPLVAEKIEKFLREHE